MELERLLFTIVTPRAARSSSYLAGPDAVDEAQASRKHADGVQMLHNTARKRASAQTR